MAAKVKIKDVVGLEAKFDAPRQIFHDDDFIQTGVAVPSGYTEAIPIFKIKDKFVRVGTDGYLPVLDGRNLTNLSGTTGSIKTISVNYVDAVYGNDDAAAIDDAGKPFLTIQAAMNALPSIGGIVKIGIGSFAKPTVLTKANIKFIGSGKPVTDAVITQSSLANVTYSVATKLVGGTIIKGGMNFFDLDGIQFHNLGIDNGSDYVVYGGGTEFNALGFARSVSSEAANTPAPPYVLLKGIVVSNVNLLCMNYTSPYHGLVIEDCIAPFVENVTARYGVHGFAIKTTNGIFRNLQSSNNGSNNCIIKSNDYSVANSNIIDGFNFSNAANGIIFQNRSNVIFKSCRVTNGFIKDCTNGVNTADDFGFGFSDINLHGVDLIGCSTPFANNLNYKYWGSSDGTFYQNYVTGGTSGAAATVIPPSSTTGWVALNFTTVNNIQNVGANVWKAITNTAAYGNKGLSSTSLPDTTDGAIRLFYNGANAEGSFIGFSNTNAIAAYSAMQVGFNIIGGNVQAFESNNPTIINGAIVGNFYRIARTGSAFTLDTSTDGVTWTLVRTFGYTSTIAMYPVTDIYGDVSQYSLFHPEKNF